MLSYQLRIPVSDDQHATRVGFFCRWILVWGLFLLTTASNPMACTAGGGPENVVLVVNGDSATSKLIANFYIDGRLIPTRNVIYLNGIPDVEIIDLEIFRDKILKPVFQQIEERKIGNNIDYIVYSADFPTIIDIPKHAEKLAAELKQHGQTIQSELYLAQASLNSATYFAGAVLSDQPGYMLLDANTYYRQPAEKLLRQPFVGARQKEFEDAIATFEKSQPEFDEGLKQLKEMAELNPQQIALSYWIARFYARSNDAKQATHWLTQAVRSGWSFRSQTRADLAFNNVKNDPLFKGIVDAIADDPFDFVPTRGFKQAYAWAPNGMLNREPGQGNRFLLSTVLAITRNFGTTEKEALRQLRASMKADGTHPKGTFYFSETADVRSTTRQPNFKSAIEALKRLGQKSEIITTDLPVQKRDVLGLSTGIATFSWTATGSKIVPGAICENLTSYGGMILDEPQTKLAEFLRNDAAGSSGTVIEPFAIQAKFPHPLIHAHYASGCSLAEAYYQSVEGPFQLLIVGDALCQPWATPPVFQVKGIAAGEKIKGTVKLNLDWSASKVPVAGMEMYVDGVQVLRDRTRPEIAFDTTELSDGFHELRLVAIANNSLETTGRVVLPFQVDNAGLATELKTSRDNYLITDTVKFTAKSNFGDSIELTHNMRSIAKKIGREAEFEVAAELLGRGPVFVEAISIDESGKVVASTPLRLMIKGPLSERNRMTARK